MSDRPAFARAGRTDPGGKMTARLDVPVTTELEEAVIALATLAGVPKSEFVRRIVERAVFGELSMMRKLSRSACGDPWEESPTGVAS